MIKNKEQQPRIHYVPIRVRRMLHIHPHVDGGWFWSKYSAHPYLGCSYGCSYCFLRGSRYRLSQNQGDVRIEDPFSQIIRYKVNAADVLDRELMEVSPDIIIVGDYQPAEAHFNLSRKLLEVCLKRRFPVLVIVKSLLVLRDLDILLKLRDTSWVSVVFSIVSAQSTGYREIFEPFASTIESRFQALRMISSHRIYAGVSLMPVMPGINDSEENITSIVQQTVENGGQFVIGGGLALLDGQKQFFYDHVRRFDPALERPYRRLYRSSCNPQDESWVRIGRMIKRCCRRHHIDYRMRRYIPKGPLSVNKQLAEQVFLRVYDMELDGVDDERVWRWRHAAWKVDELPTPLTDPSTRGSVFSEFDEDIRRFLHAQEDTR